MRLFGLILLGVTVLGMGGCVPTSSHVQKSHFSGELQARIGDGVSLNTSARNDLPSGIQTGDSLTEADAIAIALWNNPKFNESLSELGIERGKLAEAGQLANPNFSILFPFGPKQLEFTATFPLEALWLRSQRIAIAKLDAEAVSKKLVQGGLDLVRDVRLALVEYQSAMERHAMATNALVIQNRISQIAEARRSAGEGPDIEAATAKAEENRIQEEVRGAEEDKRIAKERLLHLMGVTGLAANLDFQPAEAVKTPSLSAEDLEKRALAARPDLRASELAVERAAKLARLADFEWLTISGILDANNTPNGMDVGPGAAFTIPIFHQNQGPKTKAKAEVERSAWHLIGSRQQVIFEVRQAHARLARSIDAMARWETGVVSPLTELVHTSEKAYELGELSPLAVQENIRQLLAAKARAAELRAEQRKALAELQRAVGAQLEPSPPK